MNPVGRYRIIRSIGRGGMAEVLEAVAVGEAGFERRVAIKRMLPDEATEDGNAARDGRMFLDEARIASQLHHAGIVGVLDYGLADGVPFQVLEYVDGVDVGELSERGPIPVALALHIALAVAHALDHAHTATDAHGRLLGIVHRDVTPANILVSRAGDVKLTDFGIAFAHVKSEQTVVGTTKGTPHYMAPEQMLGDPTDARADVFSLGCVLHAMVAGASPLASATQRSAVVSGVELELAADIPEDVRAVIARATRHAARERYASAREMVTAVAASIAQRPAIDPRTALRDWIAEESQPPPVLPVKAGRLDAFLVLDADDAVRSFHTISDPTRPERPAVLPPPPVVPPPPPARKSRAAPVAIAGALFVGAAIVVAVLTTRTTSETVAVADAGVRSPDAMTVVVAPPDATLDVPPDAPLDAGVTRVAKVRDPVAPRVDEEARTWATRHGRAAAEFTAWSSSHQAASRALRAWDDRTGGSRALLEWLVANRGSSISDYATAHPQSGLGAIATRYGDDLVGVSDWVGAFGKQTRNLVRRGGGLPWP